MFLYEKDFNNGYISLEIDFFLEDDVFKSIDEVKRLFKILNCFNVMIKVLVSESGFEVVSVLIKAFIFVNVILVFLFKIVNKIV